MELAIKLNDISACPVCTVPYDSKGNVPIVLHCGHSFCSKCIERMTKNTNPLPLLDEVTASHIECPICRENSYGTISSFKKNFQLLDAINESRKSVTRNALNNMACSECKEFCSEKQFRICSKCAIKKEGFMSIDQIIYDLDMGSLNRLAICANCVLKSHMQHDLKEFFPTRIKISVEKHHLEMHAKKSEYKKMFLDLKDKLQNTPRLVESIEMELTQIFDIMARADSSMHLEDIVKMYNAKMRELTFNTEQMIESLCRAEEHFRKCQQQINQENTAFIERKCSREKPEKEEISIADLICRRAARTLQKSCFKSKAEINFSLLMLIVFWGLTLKFFWAAV